MKDTLQEDIEDVIANPNDVEYDDVGDGFFLDVALEDVLVKDLDVDALVVHFVDVHCLPDADPFIDVHLLALDVELYGDEILFDDLPVLDDVNIN